MLNKATARVGHEAGGNGTFVTSWIEGEIYVNNLAFQKRVGLRWSPDGGESWTDTEAAHAGPVTEGTFAPTLGAELWRFKTPMIKPDTLSTAYRLAIYYEDLATGEWHWDNNFGQDYHLNKADGSVIE